VGRRLGLAPENPAMQLADSTLWNIRFPRVLLGVLAGAALGTSGAVMQSVFGNPLAEPGVIGVSSGAAVGACLSIVLNLQFFGIFTTPAFAFVGALAATALVYFLSRSSGRAKVLSMILTGIAVTAVAVSLFMTISKQNAYFVYESELYSRFLPSANKIAILFVKSQKESVLCLRVL